MCHPLPVRWLLRGKRTRPSSSSGPLQRNPTTWLATTSTSVWRVPKIGCQPITNLTRAPSESIKCTTIDWTTASVFYNYPFSLTTWLCVCSFVVSGLTKGETYVFRVQAINELGLSEESQESAPITIKAALSPFSCLLCLCSPELIATVKIILHFFSSSLCSV